MGRRPQISATLPAHVFEEIARRAKALGKSESAYLSHVASWWFEQGCPSVTAEDAELRKILEQAIRSRVKPVPKDINIWALNSADVYNITDDKIVQTLLDQLGLPNLFAAAAEHDAVRMAVAFDNHPSHWLQFDFYKGSASKSGDGLAFAAYPKATTSRAEMLAKLQDAAREMESDQQFGFSQIPAPVVKKHETVH